MHFKILEVTHLHSSFYAAAFSVLFSALIDIRLFSPNSLDNFAEKLSAPYEGQAKCNRHFFNATPEKKTVLECAKSFYYYVAAIITTTKISEKKQFSVCQHRCVSSMKRPEKPRSHQNVVYNECNTARKLLLVHSGWKK